MINVRFKKERAGSKSPLVSGFLGQPPFICERFQSLVAFVRRGVFGFLLLVMARKAVQRLCFSADDAI